MCTLSHSFIIRKFYCTRLDGSVSLSVESTWPSIRIGFNNHARQRSYHELYQQYSETVITKFKIRTWPVYIFNFRQVNVSTDVKLLNSCSARCVLYKFGVCLCEQKLFLDSVLLTNSTHVETPTFFTGPGIFRRIFEWGRGAECKMGVDSCSRVTFTTSGLLFLRSWVRTKELALLTSLSNSSFCPFKMHVIYQDLNLRLHKRGEPSVVSHWKTRWNLKNLVTLQKSLFVPLR